MPTTSAVPPKLQFFSSAGTPLVGGKLYSYAAGTTTPQATYTDYAGGTPNTNPVILDSRGEASVWMASSLYKLKLTDANDVEIWTVDNVGGADQATLTALAASGGSALVGFLQDGIGANTRTVQSKLRDVVSVKDFGAVGNGSTDDTLAIQEALDSGAKTVVFPAGGTYIINGGLTLTVTGVTVQATGATIKLKNNASSLSMLSITANDCVVDGGTWDGNKAGGNSGVWGSAQYNSYNVLMQADRCTVKNIRSINTWGMGVKGFGNFLSVLNCNIADTTHYGIFFDGSASVSHQGNRAIGNTIDMSAGEVVSGANQGQGILFTAGTGQNQITWELADNIITGPTTSVTDQAINLAVRGKEGVVSNNLTRYGGMGFSEGGANTVITGNRFLELRGNTRYGIEPSGKFTAVGNFITDAYEGFSISGANNFDGSTIAGNVINVAAGGNSMGIRYLLTGAGTAKNIAITANTINTPFFAVYLTGDCSGAIISGNTFLGPGSGSGRALFLDTPTATINITVVNNAVRSFERAWAVYSVPATTFTNAYTANNSLIDIGGSEHFWNAEGAAIIGARFCNINVNNGTRSVIDQAANVFFWYTDVYNNPEGLLAGGVGSILVSRNSGGGIWRKDTGTGNTGWVAM